MSKNITIIDKDYKAWIQELGHRYRQSQIKAAVKVNQEMLRFYWSLGKDIVDHHMENTYGSGFFKNLSTDLKKLLPDAKGLSVTTLKYTKYFYELYSPLFDFKNCQQVADNLETDGLPQTVVISSGNGISYQIEVRLEQNIYSIPWGHHMLIIDKCKSNVDRALFYVCKTIENGWSRDVLLNFLDSGLYEREGKAITNFKQTLPEETSDLAQEMTKDPYCFGFTGFTTPYNEWLLKKKLLENITKFLIELGTGFAYVGQEYRLIIGDTEKFVDLLFYHLNLRCYVVVEVKIGKLDFRDVGQLGGYVASANHILRKDGLDNPTIGLLIYKEKGNLLAQYALESSSQPLGISEYDLAKLYPAKVEGEVPTIEEIEAKLKDGLNGDEFVDDTDSDKK